MNTPRIIREEGIFERGTHYRLFVPYNWIERQSFVRLRLVWWLIKLACARQAHLGLGQRAHRATQER